MQPMPDRFCGGLHCKDIVRWTSKGWRHVIPTKANRKHPPIPGDLVSNA